MELYWFKLLFAAVALIFIIVVALALRSILRSRKRESPDDPPPPRAARAESPAMEQPKQQRPGDEAFNRMFDHTSGKAHDVPLSDEVERFKSAGGHATRPRRR